MRIGYHFFWIAAVLISRGRFNGSQKGSSAPAPAELMFLPKADLFQNDHDT